MQNKTFAKHLENVLEPSTSRGYTVEVVSVQLGFNSLSFCVYSLLFFVFCAHVCCATLKVIVWYCIVLYVKKQPY